MDKSSSPPDTASQLLDRLHLLTLALAEAAPRASSTELAGLLTERRSVLDRLGKIDVAPNDLEKARSVQAAELEALRAFTDERRKVVDEIGRSKDGRRVRTAYSARGDARAFDASR